MGVFVKICGIASCEDMLAVEALKPDAIGFVCWPRSPRYADPENMVRWVRELRTSVLTVGVFVDPDPREALSIARRASLDVIQVHGTTDVEHLARSGDFKVWRAVHTESIKPREMDAASIDALLIDTYSEEVPGGTGKTGNWEDARRFVKESRIPVLLAGGLNPGNVAEAIRLVKPWGIDASSCLEAAPGKKDLCKTREFLRQCRSVK